MAAQSSALLSLDQVSKRFGGLAALSEVSFEARRGEVLGLIGPNGAGKSTCINVITGFFPPDNGKIWFNGKDITASRTHSVALDGLTRTFQLPSFFQSCTVLEHLTIACTQAQRVGNFRIFFNTPAARRATQEAKRRAMEIIEVAGLGEYANHKPGELSTGWKRWLALTMGMGLDPSLLLLDEPFAGLSASQREKTVDLLKDLHEKRELTILLVAHQVSTVMTFCDRIVVLNFGRKICEGTPDLVRNDPRVIDAYLGGHNGQSPVPARSVSDEMAGVPAPAVPEAAPTPASSLVATGLSHQAKSKPLLEVKNLVVRFGAVQALRGVSISVSDGEIVAIIGANGAGKSVLLKAITGVIRPAEGEVAYDGKPIVGWPTYRIARAGVGIVPEGRRLFRDMTVSENLLVGAGDHDKKTIAEDLDRVHTMFPRLNERRNQIADTLSGGEQEMVAIGRALMMHARLLLLDEPSLGMAPKVVEDIAEAIAALRGQQHIGVVLVEQNARMALGVADRAYVLENGQVVVEGPADEVAKSDLVRHAYLGA